MIWANDFDFPGLESYNRLKKGKIHLILMFESIDH